MLISSMVPPEASACMLWGGMSSCAQYHSNNGLERLVLRSAPHVFRRGHYPNLATLRAFPKLIDKAGWLI